MVFDADGGRGRGHSVGIDLSVQDNNKNVLRSIFVLKL